MTFGEKLIKARKSNNYTQEGLAEKLNVTRQTVSNWELNQTKPDVEQLKEISKLYKISIDDLVDNDIKGSLTEKVNNTEKLTGLIYKILKCLIITIGIFVSLVILLVIVAFILYFINRSDHTPTINKSEILVSCKLEDDYYEFIVKAQPEENSIIISGDRELMDELGLEYKTEEYQVIRTLSDYFEEKGGSCI